ncbi:MAG: Arm DNA-binding domain-containing protein [Asticcacaulis sp.]|nr:Arm DNA-binding domain-containing protein [Asticcacaulis sp.]
MALSDTALRNAKPQATKYKLYDDGGLLVVVTPTGGKLWRFKYRFGGAEKQLSLGGYPDVSLKDARGGATKPDPLSPMASIPVWRRREGRLLRQLKQQTHSRPLRTNL